VREYDRRKGKSPHYGEQDHDAQLLAALESKIDGKLAKFSAGGFVRFVASSLERLVPFSVIHGHHRLSTRSPKDAVLHNESVLRKWKVPHWDLL